MLRIPTISLRTAASPNNSKLAGKVSAKTSSYQKSTDSLLVSNGHNHESDKIVAEEEVEGDDESRQKKVDQPNGIIMKPRLQQHKKAPAPTKQQPESSSSSSLLIVEHHHSGGSSTSSPSSSSSLIMDAKDLYDFSAPKPLSVTMMAVTTTANATTMTAASNRISLNTVIFFILKITELEVFNFEFR